MKKTLLIIIITFASATINAQSVQLGYTEEYNGAKDKTPLAKVNINAGGATAKSGRDGKFKLEFKTLKVGDHISLDINSVVTLKDYVLFNKEALEQWTVSEKNNYFRIVLCKKKTFDNLVMTYYSVSDKSLKEQLYKERENARKQKEQGEIQQLEYEKLLKEADERYQNAVKHIRENAELVARIDESELEGNQAEILSLAKEGKLDEAVKLIQQDNTIELFAKAVTKNEFAAKQKEYYEQKEIEAREEIKHLATILKNNIKILQLAGGKDNYDLCEEYWMRIIAADTTNLANLRECANFFYDQTNFELTEKYLVMSLTICEKLYKQSPKEYVSDYTAIFNNLGNMYYQTNQYQKSEEYYLQALQIYKSQAMANIDDYYSYYAKLLNNLGNLYYNIKHYQKAEEFQVQALQIYKSLADKSPDIYNFNYAMSLTNLGNIYRSTRRYQQAEEHFLESMQILKSLADKYPDNVHNSAYATSLNCLGDLYLATKQNQKAEEYQMMSLQLSKELAGNNPDAYNSFYVSSLSIMGKIYFSMEQLQKAGEYYLQALQISKSLAEKNPAAFNPSYASALTNMADIYRDVNQFQKAEEYYIQALQIKKSLAETYPNVFSIEYALSLFNLGFLNMTIGQYEKADEHLIQAMQLCKSMAEFNPDVFMPCYIQSLGGLAFNSIYRKQFADAEKYSRECLSIDSSTMVAINTHLVISILLQGRYNEAEKIAKDIMNIEWNGTLLKNFILYCLNDYESKDVIPEERKADVERLKKVLE